MAPNIFFTSDHHFHHENILTFRDTFGNLIRPGFTDVHHMDEVMIERWNSVVRPQDKVYHLGDVTLGRKLTVMGRLNGTKVLIKGNHDTAKLSEYAKYFKDVRATHRIDNRFVLSHVPLHPNHLIPQRDWIINVHGHLHTYSVVNEYYDENGVILGYSEDSTYYSVCVERHNYTPVSLEELRKATNVS